MHQFRIALMQFVSQLAMVPVPPPGSLGIVRSCFGESSIIFCHSNTSSGLIMLVISRVYSGLVILLLLIVTHRNLSYMA